MWTFTETPHSAYVNYGIPRCCGVVLRLWLWIIISAGAKFLFEFYVVFLFVKNNRSPISFIFSPAFFIHAVTSLSLALSVSSLHKITVLLILPIEKISILDNSIRCLGIADFFSKIFFKWKDAYLYFEVYPGGNASSLLLPEWRLFELSDHSLYYPRPITLPSWTKFK